MLKRLPFRFEPSLERVVLRPRWLGDGRSQTLIAQVLALPEVQQAAWLQRTRERYQQRHRDLEARLRKHGHWALAQAGHSLEGLSDDQILLLGAYFSMEYAIEAAAFFNPSVVLAPDQSGLQSGQQRLYVSFRAVGEGHISSIVFQEAVLETDGSLSFVVPERFVELPEVAPLAAGSQEQALVNAISLPNGQEAQALHSEAYCARFSPQTPLAERVLFPQLPVESHGLEDARFVRFQKPEGGFSYYATYTAYNGREIQPRLLQTDDFCSFVSLKLSGEGAQNKNLALFPRQLQGQYAMLARLDGVNNFLMFSEHLTHWQQPILLNTPEQPWELGNTGNCGSPIETEAGWLVITHGVGPMREYVISALLLNRQDPRQIIGRLKEPLLLPEPGEREGYVPNVVYSCGAFLNGDQLLLPYGASDRFAGIASIDLAALLAALQRKD